MTSSQGLRGLAVFLLIALVETLHGALRTVLLAPAVGDLASRQIGVLTGSVLILLVAWMTTRWTGVRSVSGQFRLGALWVALMLVFEFGLGWLLGMPAERLLEDYRLDRGGLMPIGLLVLLCAPWLSARLRGTAAQPPARR